MEESQPEPWNIHDCPTFGRISFPLEIGVSLLVYCLTKGKLQDQIKACGKLLSIVYIYILICTVCKNKPDLFVANKIHIQYITKPGTCENSQGIQ